ncbi:MAG: cobalamin-dependent protein, partial [Tumebacillaceae bacterium]
METTIYRPKHKVRFVTASSLFDGHDASINIMRRILQASGAEVIHLGHNRAAEEVVNAAIQEDAQGIAISSYQGGHVEYFKYIYDMLNERGAGHIKIFGGGGGVIVPDEIRDLEGYGIAKIYSPDDGRRIGLQGMINDMLERSDFPTPKQVEAELAKLPEKNVNAVAKLISFAEEAVFANDETHRNVLTQLQDRGQNVPVVGITGTGGAGKSSLTDELVRRFLNDFADKTIAILSIDPSKQKTGGALLGDRIRMNSIHNPRAYMRSLATRESRSELSAAIKEAIDVCKVAGYDLILVETSGIGQGDAEITKVCDISMYVMTSEFGAPSQLEKIDMLDFADLVAINKFERKGSADALRDVKKQFQRNHNLWEQPTDAMPIYGTIASQFNDPGTNVLYRALIDTINRKKGTNWESSLEITDTESKKNYIIPPDRTGYLGEIVNSIRDYKKFTE